jgi:hypothetical protein
MPFLVCPLPYLSSFCLWTLPCGSFDTHGSVAIHVHPCPGLWAPCCLCLICRLHSQPLASGCGPRDGCDVGPKQEAKWWERMGPCLTTTVFTFSCACWDDAVVRERKSNSRLSSKAGISSSLLPVFVTVLIIENTRGQENCIIVCTMSPSLLQPQLTEVRGLMQHTGPLCSWRDEWVILKSWVAGWYGCPLCRIFFTCFWLGHEG